MKQTEAIKQIILRIAVIIILSSCIEYLHSNRYDGVVSGQLQCRMLSCVAVSIYAAIILSGVFLDGVSPLVYELVCEAAYPAGEGVSSCFLQMLFVLAGIAFTSVQEIPNIGTLRRALLTLFGHK